MTGKSTQHYGNLARLMTLFSLEQKNYPSVISYDLSSMITKKSQFFLMININYENCTLIRHVNKFAV